MVNEIADSRKLIKGRRGKGMCKLPLALAVTHHGSVSWTTESDGNLARPGDGNSKGYHGFPGQNCHKK